MVGASPESAIVAGSATAQVSLNSGAVVYFGSASNTTAPATIDAVTVRDATPEWREIQTQGIRRGSARYKLLMTALDERIRTAVRRTSRIGKCDFVTRSGDIRDPQGKVVKNVTSLVIRHL